MFGLKKRKRQRQYIIEGLSMLEDKLKVWLGQAEWHLGFDDLTEQERTMWETSKRYCNHLLQDIKDIWDGKLHY